MESNPGLQIPSVSYFYNGQAKPLSPNSPELQIQILQLESITSKDNGQSGMDSLLKLGAGIHNTTLNEGDLLLVD